MGSVCIPAIDPFLVVGVQVKCCGELAFTSYFFLIIYITVFFLACIILYPEDIREYSGFEDYFYSRKTWFFLALAIGFALDIVDTLLKGRDYYRSLSIEYPIRNAIHIILCLVAMKANNKKFHATLVILLIVYELIWIFRLYRLHQG